MLTPSMFSEDAQAIINLVNDTKDHLFVTGKAGTGKSTLLKYIHEQDPSIIDKAIIEFNNHS